MTEVEVNVINALMQGPKKIKDLELYFYGTFKNRKVRKCIEELRAMEFKIANMQDGNGYILTNNETILKAWRRQELSRANKIIKATKPTEDYLISRGVEL